jgi:hypothetical protein
MPLLMDLSMYTAAISAVLLLVLAIIYLRVYKDTRAQFSLGLAVFASILFAQNVVAVFSFLTMASYIGDAFLPFLLTINLAQVLGVAVLLRTTTH